MVTNFCFRLFFILGFSFNIVFASQALASQISEENFITEIPVGTTMRFNYEAPWYMPLQKDLFLHLNKVNPSCRIHTSRASNVHLEELAGDSSLDIKITSFTLNRSFKNNHRQIVNLIFDQGWVTCVINKTETLSVIDIQSAFPNIQVSFISPKGIDPNTSRRSRILSEIASFSYLIDAKSMDNKMGGKMSYQEVKNCSFISDTSTDKIEDLKISSYFYESRRNKITLAYEGPEDDPTGRVHPLILHCDDNLDSLHETLVALGPVDGLRDSLRDGAPLFVDNEPRPSSKR